MNVAHKMQSGGMNGYVGVEKDLIVAGIIRPVVLIHLSKNSPLGHKTIFFVWVCCTPS